jgi:hypothetical protein
MLAGYGNFPDDAKLRPPGPEVVPIDMAGVEGFVAGCAMNFPTHADALGRLAEAA